MLLAYVDESYTDGHYWMVALVCPEAAVIPLGSALDAVVGAASAAHPSVSPNAELHGYPLFHGEGEWAALKSMPRVRIGVYNSAFAAIGGSGARIIIRGVNRGRLEARYVRPKHPHAVVLEHLLERIDELAEERDELALVIADEIDQADTYRRKLWQFQRFATEGYRSRQLTRIVDTLHFVPSQASRLIQAADLLVFMHRRIASRADTDERALRANQNLWDRVQSCVLHNWCWDP